MDDPLQLDRQVCFALSAAARQVVSLYKPVLEPLGLTHPQYLVMLALWEKSPRRLNDISDTLRLEPGTVSPIVKRLEDAGLVTREKAADDERALAIRLTADGLALREQALNVPPAIVARLGMSIAELEAARDVLTGLLEASRPAEQSDVAAAD